MKNMKAAILAAAILTAGVCHAENLWMFTISNGATGTAANATNASPTIRGDISQIAIQRAGAATASNVYTFVTVSNEEANVRTVLIVTNKPGDTGVYNPIVYGSNDGGSTTNAERYAYPIMGQQISATVANCTVTGANATVLVIYNNR